MNKELIDCKSTKVEICLEEHECKYKHDLKLDEFTIYNMCKRSYR